MKKKSLLLIAIAAIVFTSCKSTIYYQVYKTAPSNEMVNKGNKIAYEDENCMVSYNLWEDGGNMGFLFTNKTEKDIYLYLEESYFILNGIAYNYYKDRVFTSTASSGVSESSGVSASKSIWGINYFNYLQTNKGAVSKSAELMQSKGSSVSFNEQKIVCVPSNTSKVINEYNITSSLVRDCDLLRYPSRKRIRTKYYSEKESPLVFSNRITYALENSSNVIKFENEFYVTEVTNYPEKEVVENEYTEFCGEKSNEKEKYFKNTSPDKFYLRYTKGKKGFKH